MHNSANGTLATVAPAATVARVTVIKRTRDLRKHADGIEMLVREFCRIVILCSFPGPSSIIVFYSKVDLVQGQRGYSR